MGTQRDPPTKSTTQASRKERETERERGGEKKIDRERVRETKNVRHIRHGLLLLL